ncbi:thioredoxin [Spirosoma sp. KNUC1025]|uniref:thioredoxin n=1 Tax=Spirosoma sp. KNUC1025 TaxID=2894082 RepID=UPI003863E663|nr:thioredoxin [Spirosoma sp. KNUC1025]
MNTSHTKLMMSDSALPVLLTFLPADVKPVVQEMVAQLQPQLSGKIRVIKIEETAHPMIVQSFDLKQLPAFVLLLQGIELWRQEGLPETNLLALLPKNLLND